MDEEKEDAVETPLVKVDPVANLLANISSDNHTTELITVPVKIDHLQYQIVEMDGVKRGEFTDFRSKKTRFSATGEIIGIKDAKGIETKLVTLSLKGPDGNYVSEEFAQKLPGSLLNKIALVSARISCLDGNAEQTAKNS